jgi:glycosyltransferase involved in cell wall biosynthesis
MGGATDFALKIADSISRQSKNRTVLIVETGPPRQSRVKLSKVDSNTYVLNPLTSRNYRAVSPELKFWLELSVQLGAKSHTGISSKIFFDLLTLYGQALRLTSRTGALFFCPDYDVSGYDIGHSVSYFAQIADTLDYILTDNQSHIPELIQKYGLPDSISDKVHFLYYPLSSESNPVVAEPLDNERLKILWAGRFSKQKGVSELVQIAATLRDLDFLVFGGTKSQFPIRPIPKNMKILGAFEGIDSLSKHKAHLYLNTSHWDGRPITMLQFLARKTPVLSSSSGGLKEMLVGPDSTAIIVDDSTDVSEYVARLTEIETNRQRLSNLSAATNLRLISQHSKDGFDSVLNQALNLSSH